MPSESSIRNTIRLHNRLHNLWNERRGYYSKHNANSSNKLSPDKFINKFEEILILHRLGVNITDIIDQLKLKED